MAETITISLRQITQRVARLPEWPELAMFVESHDLVVGTLLKDGDPDATIETAKRAIAQLMIVPITHWETERDAARRATELVGTFPLIKHSAGAHSPAWDIPK